MAFAGHEENPSAKRRRLDGTSTSSRTPQEVRSVHDLRDFLLFDQSSGPQARQGIQSFKNFLNSIAQTEDQTERSRKLDILRSYCDVQISSQEEGQTAVCFPDLTKTWSFAETNNNESLLSTVPSVLALFLKTVSTHLDFKDFGVALCKHLMQREQLKLFNRNLTASKTKDHLLSPILRLLTEIVAFDAGAVARLVYARQDITFKRLDLLLGLQKEKSQNPEEDRRKPSIRRLAQRYLLAHLKFQDFGIKSEIVSQVKVMRAFLQDIRHDSRDIVLEIVRTIDKTIVLDQEVPRNIKSRVLNHWNLSKIATLYGFEKDADDPQEGDKSVAEVTHKFLKSVCTDPEKGVLLPETGWYPPGNNPDAAPADGKDMIELGLDSPLYFDSFRENVPVRNGTLSTFVQTLRPELDTLQMELLLKIFKAAPELVAHYFTKRKMFTSDPKPVASWFGESAFLFSTVKLPVPADCGWKEGKPTMPPPVSITIENILPRPLTQKMLTRCLNQNNDVITLFALRLTTTAFQKLQSVLKEFQRGSEAASVLWTQASQKVMVEFCRRCPAMKDVITLFRRTAKDDLDQQWAVAELLAMYYKVTPSLALEEKFDVSLTLLDVLGQIESSDGDRTKLDALLKLLSHLLDIAQQSPTMKWWQKPESLNFSPFTSILKVLIETADEGPRSQIKNLLQAVMFDGGVLEGRKSFEALLASLKSDEKWRPIPSTFTFIDNCITRLVKYPVLYQDQVSKYIGSNDPTDVISPLIATIREQWPFVIKAEIEENEQNISEWISRLLAYMAKAGESLDGLKSLRDEMVDVTSSKGARSSLKKSFKRDVEDSELSLSDPVTSPSEPDSSENAAAEETVDLEEFASKSGTDNPFWKSLWR